MQTRSWVAPDEEECWNAFLDKEGITVLDLYHMTSDEEEALVKRFREEYYS